MARKRDIPEPADGQSIQITFSTSRGRETYGYGVVSLRIREALVARCNGGGFDMKGTVVGDWMEQAFKSELVALAKAQPERFESWYDTVAKVSTSTRPKERHTSTRGTLYGATVYTRNGEPERVVCDGGCGFRSMETILGAIGWELKWVGGEKRRAPEWYTLHKLPAPVFPL